MKQVVLGLFLLGVAVNSTSCIVKRLSGPRLTGTCDGACSHYVACKPGHPKTDGDRCRRECPEVFSDSESLMMFESLSCHDVVEYVDGRPSAPTAATSQAK